MNVAAGGPAGALERGPAAGLRRRAPLASLRIGEPPRSRTAGPQGPFVQVINCPPKRVRSSTPEGRRMDRGALGRKPFGTSGAPTLLRTAVPCRRCGTR